MKRTNLVLNADLLEETLRVSGERTYSRAMNPTEAIAECRRCAGSQFSPAVVEILTRPGFERVLRMFANEQATRDRNEARLADDAGSTFNLHCECGAEDCPAMVEIGRASCRERVLLGV